MQKRLVNVNPAPRIEPKICETRLFFPRNSPIFWEFCQLKQKIITQKRGLKIVDKRSILDYLFVSGI